MLRTILIGLDGTDDGAAAMRLGIRWAQRYEAITAGIAVVDEPGIELSETAMFSGSRHVAVVGPLVATSRRQAKELLSEFARRCDEAKVAYRLVEATGTPYVEILAEAQRYDVILIGTATHFAFGWRDEPDETLFKILRDCPRPVIAVPHAPAEGDAVVVAYDGSLQAARALAAFEASGLGRNRDIHLLGVAAELRAAARHLDRAGEYLRFHNLRVTTHAVDTPLLPEDVILKYLERHHAGLLVMGAYGEPRLREFFLGSVTRSMLRTSPVPLFLAH
jgi:nucleotide-binding universal stress UspA family protein